MSDTQQGTIPGCAWKEDEMKKKKTKKRNHSYVIFKKTAEGSFPGEYWEEFTNKAKASYVLGTVYGVDYFRLVKITYEELK